MARGWEKRVSDWIISTINQFGYAGMVTPRCAISLYMSSERLSEHELMAVMDEVGSKIEFDRTPLETLN